jgi:hypothetical protein
LTLTARSAPDGIAIGRHLDLKGRKKDPWVRRGLLTLVVCIPVVALFNVFGQRPTTSRAADAAAVLSVYSPVRVRGGLLYTSRFHVTARTDPKRATLVLDSGWFEGMQINSISPQPLGEGSHDGNIVLQLGHIPAGHSAIYFIEFQVNPTNIGHRSQNVELDDGKTRLFVIHRTITIFP